MKDVIFLSGPPASTKTTLIKDFLEIECLPSDQKRTLLIKKSSKNLKRSNFWAKNIQIKKPTGLAISIDGQKITKTPAKITQAKNQISVIVGKNRKIKL